MIFRLVVFLSVHRVKGVTTDSRAHLSGLDMSDVVWNKLPTCADPATHCRELSTHLHIKDARHYAHMEVVVDLFRVDSKMLTSKFWFSLGLISNIWVEKAPGGL